MSQKYEIERDELVLLLRSLDAYINEHNLDDEGSKEIEVLRKWEERLGGSIMYGTL